MQPTPLVATPAARFERAMSGFLARCHTWLGYAEAAVLLGGAPRLGSRDTPVVTRPIQLPGPSYSFMAAAPVIGPIPQTPALVSGFWDRRPQIRTCRLLGSALAVLAL